MSYLESLNRLLLIKNIEMLIGIVLLLMLGELNFLFIMGLLGLYWEYDL